MIYKLFTLFLIALTVLSCTSKEDLSTDTYSSSFSTKPDKINFLEKYYTPITPYKDIEYHIVYHDNASGRGVPGPSDLYMKLALKIHRSNINKWIANHLESKPVELSKWSEILPKTKYWSMEGEKKYYDDGTVWIVDNDIILTGIRTH
ncbi:MAG: hypothetical protein ACJASQ_003742 [Crocinitomicaceae bacterium]|jgi:hypothetical protein